MFNDYFVINLAPTGVIPQKSDTPFVPVTKQEIIDEVACAIDLGVQMFHLHARDSSGKQSSDPALYGELIRGVRALKGGEQAVICVTTSGRDDPSYESRCKVLDLKGAEKPDMASLTLSSLNFAQTASINAPDTIRALADHMMASKIKPELEVFDLGMVNFIKVLAKEKRIEPPFYINVLLGNVFGAQPTLPQIAALVSALPDESTICFSGLGRFQLLSNQLGLLLADGVRVGLEDNIWFDNQRTTLASNAMLINRVKESAALLGKVLLPVDKLRSKLNL